MSRGKMSKRYREASTCRILMSAGGTGGHIFPALAVAEYMRERSIAECIFVGAYGRMEMDIVPRAGFRVIGLPIRGFQRRKWWKNWDLPFRVLWSCCRAYLMVRRLRPHLLFGTGGYVAFPVMLMRALLRVPTVVLEANAWAGWSNRLLGRWADRVCVSYPRMERFFSAKKVLRTGTPLRASLGALLDEASARRRLGLHPDRETILVMGGSLGAGTLNRSMERSWERLLEQGYQLIWQTGAAHYAPLRSSIPLRHSLILKSFLEEVDVAYGAASLVVARAGALTVAELLRVAKPTILVPAELVTEDHQRRNAEALAQAGAAYCVLDRDAERALLPLIEQIIEDSEERTRLSVQMKGYAQQQYATEAVVAEIIRSATKYMRQRDGQIRLLGSAHLAEVRPVEQDDRVSMDLRGIDLSGADLRGIDLSRTNLSGANFADSDLSGAQFEEEKAQPLDQGLEAKKLGHLGANSDLSGAQFEEEKAQPLDQGLETQKLGHLGADSDLSGAKFEEKAQPLDQGLEAKKLGHLGADSDLSGAKFEEKAQPLDQGLEAKKLGHLGADSDLSGAKFEEERAQPLDQGLETQKLGHLGANSDLSGAQFEEEKAQPLDQGLEAKKLGHLGANSDLSGAQFEEEKAQPLDQGLEAKKLGHLGANFSGSDLSGANFSGADLSGAVLIGARLPDELLSARHKQSLPKSCGHE